MKLATTLVSLFSITLFGLMGCHELGHMDGPGDYGGIFGNNDLVGEVQNVDTRAREIEIRTENGRREYVRYDNKTRVLYRQQEYAVSNLEPGDYVAMRAQPSPNGGYTTDYITVRESVQDRGGNSGRSDASGRLDRLEGTVERIDGRRGTFEVRSRNGRSVMVTMPFNASRADRQRFDRLREGDTVRVEGNYAGSDRFELEAFL